MKMIWSSGDPVEAMKYISQYATESEARKFLKAPFERYSTRFDDGMDVNHENDAINRMLAIDYQTFLVDNNLVKVDRATMSVSLEGREPMLDHRLLELISSLPSDLKIKNGVNKYLLKKIVHKYIPRELMERPKKPFIAPLTVWFKDALKEQMIQYLNEDVLVKQGIFDAKEVVHFRDRYLRGEKINYQKLWHILVFQLWHQRWMN
jgi:asparagine synthase (glutamine-hydrolysing)